MLRSRARRPVAWRLRCCWRARPRTSAPPATPPTTSAAAGRAQLRGSRMAAGSQSASSIAAASVSSDSRRSTLSVSASEGSTGTSADRNSRSTSVIGVILSQLLLELLDRSVYQHLGRALGAAEHPCYLAVVHVESEAHDQGLATVVGEVRHSGEHLLHLGPALHDLLGGVQRRDRRRVVEIGLRLA